MMRLEDATAMRFRRAYLESLTSGQIGIGTTFRLAALLLKAVASGKEVVAGALMATMTLLFTAPFGSHSLSTLHSIGIMAVALVLGLGASWIVALPVLATGVRGLTKAPVIIVLVSIASSVVLSLCLQAANWLLAGGLDLPVVTVFLRIFPVLFLAFWVGQTFATFPMSKLLSRTRKAQTLVSRLAANKRGDLYSISSQDHYVEVITSRGSELIRMKMSEALADVEPGKGIQIHRSHWVSLAAIRIVNEQKKQVELIDGRCLPVSPSRLADVVLKLSQRDDLTSRSTILADTTAPNNALTKLRDRFEERRQQLDILFLEIYRGKSVDTRQAYRIAGLSQKVGLTSPVQLVQLLVVMLAPVTFGSYGTYDPPFYMALAYWVLIFLVCGPIIQSSHFLIYLYGLRYRLQGWLVSFLLCATESTVAGCLLYLTKKLLFGDAFATLPQFLLGVYLSNIVLHTYAHFEMFQYRSIVSWETRMSYPPIVLLLPYDVRGELISISARGRYVDVTTTAGTAALRTRFKDAMDQIGATSGLQVHRSHWVANAFVASRRIDSANNYVELVDGTLIPLSTANVSAVDAVIAKCAN